MAHRTLRATLIAIAFLAPAVTTFAQSFAIVVLQSGERFDGQLRGISGGMASFYSSDRRTRQVRLDDIAVMTFSGSTAGIDSGDADVAAGSDHLMVMRNGNRYAGTLEGTTTAGVRRGSSPQLLFRIRAGSQLRVRPEDVAYVRMASSYRSSSSARTAGNVTLLLDNGDIVRGQLVSMDRGALRLRTNTRTSAERSFNLADLALVDFSGGRLPVVTPPADTTGRRVEQVLELRDGRVLRGRFLGPARSASGAEAGFLFRERGGGNVTFTAGEATRLYMQDPGNLVDSESGSDDAWDRAGRSREIAVDSRSTWTPTGIFVRQGDLVRVSARGQVQLSTNSRDLAGPAGAYSGRRPPDADPAHGTAGALLGNVNGVTFVIGNNTDGIRMPATGELRLGVNDDYFGDNEGQFTVAIDAAQNRQY